MEKPYIIGIDVGGTNTVVSIVDKGQDIELVAASKTTGNGSGRTIWIDDTLINDSAVSKDESGVGSTQ